MSLHSKRVLVTGGTRGIGRATVEAFLEAGARVAVLCDHAEAKTVRRTLHVPSRRRRTNIASPYE